MTLRRIDAAAYEAMLAASVARHPSKQAVRRAELPPCDDDDLEELLSESVRSIAFDDKGHCRTCNGFREHFAWCRFATWEAREL